MGVSVRASQTEVVMDIGEDSWSKSSDLLSVCSRGKCCAVLKAMGDAGFIRSGRSEAST